MRKFYKKVIQVEILAEEPIPDMDLEDIVQEMIYGGYSGIVSTISEEEVDGKTMAELLISQNTDPEFFGLLDDGTEQFGVCSCCGGEIVGDEVLIGREGDKPRPYCYDCSKLD